MSVYQLRNPNFDTIIDYCHDLLADEKLEVYDFGKNMDLVLHIWKDSEYDPKKDEEYSDMVSISTYKDGSAVDDTGDTYVTDGSLWSELERIYNYRDLETL